MEDSDRSPLSDVASVFNNSLIASYVDPDLSSISVVSYRQHCTELALFFKLHSGFVADTGVDCYAVDNVANQYRFTVSYIFQSSVANYSFTLLTKTTEVLPLISLQSVFPAFNWAEREI